MTPSRRRLGGGHAALAATAVLVFALTAHGAPPAGAPYELNVILPLTGGAAFLGQTEWRTLQVLERFENSSGGIQGRPIHLAVQDDQTSPQLGVQLANQVLAKKVPVLLGSALVAICRAMAPLMKAGPVMYCFSPGIHPDEGSYVFTSGVSTHDLAQAGITFFRAKGWTRLAVLTSTDATGQDAETSPRASSLGIVAPVLECRNDARIRHPRLAGEQQLRPGRVDRGLERGIGELDAHSSIQLCAPSTRDLVGTRKPRGHVIGIRRAQG